MIMAVIYEEKKGVLANQNDLYAVVYKLPGLPGVYSN